jgi:5,10-methylenetetrahydrofolate reductase
MVKVIDRYTNSTNRFVIICDASPPRGPILMEAAELRELTPDFLSVAYNPGLATRANPVAVAATVRQKTGQEVVFTLATRDMNKLALQGVLLGAQMLGLENLTVVAGDPFAKLDSRMPKAVNDYTPTELLHSITELNQGVDYRGLKLHSPTDLCIGATADLARGIDRESRLAARKIEAGAQFLITQPIFDVADAARFLEAYEQTTGGPLPVPIFWGLQVLVQGGVSLAEVPSRVAGDLAAGRPGVELALELLEGFRSVGIRGVYLIPPILRGGTRDYGSAAHVLARVRK